MTCTGTAMNKSEPQEQDLFSLHPGWQPLSKIFDSPNPFYEKILFLLGYEFSSNIYILTGDEPVLVDTGNDYTAFLHLQKLPYDPSCIRKIVLTHGHRDHAMGMFELLGSYPQIIERGGFELILHEASPSDYKVAMKQAGCQVTQVRGGETLELAGLEWEVIHTPGHTIDGISLYHAPTKTAFTGDVVLPHAMAEMDKHAGGRLDHYLLAIKELLARDIENVLPGHGVPVASIGRKVIEKTYEVVMMDIIGVREKISWIQGATALAQKGLWEEALFCCDRELTLHPENREALQLKAFSLNDLGRFHEALRTLDRMETLRSQGKNDPFILMGKGYALMGMEKYAESIRFFDDVLEMAPGLKDALIYKGIALYLSGNAEKALEIEPFRIEFEGKLKDVLIEKMQSSGLSE